MAKATGENIHHFGGIRLRVTGAGILRPTLRSMDNTYSSTLATLTMSATTNREPTILSNFKQQRACLELKITELNDTFIINRIVIFVKPLYQSFQQ